MSTRAEVLGRIQRALADVPRDIAGREREYAAITREYRTGGDLDTDGRVELFSHRLADYNAGVYRTEAAELAATIAKAAAARGKHSLMVPVDLPREWLTAGIRFVPDTGLTHAELDASEGVLTGCSVAIALTGTIVLRHTAGEGRRAITLVPDYHLCVVYTDQIVETVPEGFRRLGEWSPSLLTTISGPSATADIEMTRIKGVHGPRTLDVVIANR